MTRAEDFAAEINATFADGLITFDAPAPLVRAVPRLILGKGALRARVIAAARANRPTVTVGGQTVHIRDCGSSIAYWNEPPTSDELIGTVGNIA